MSIASQYKSNIIYYHKNKIIVALRMENFVSIQDFKKYCHQIIKEIQTSRQTLFIIRKHLLIAKVVPADQNSKESILGLMRDKAKVANSSNK